VINGVFKLLVTIEFVFGCILQLIKIELVLGDNILLPHTICAGAYIFVDSFDSIVVWVFSIILSYILNYVFL
jgi:hypothetical protein